MKASRFPTPEAVYVEAGRRRATGDGPPSLVTDICVARGGLAAVTAEDFSPPFSCLLICRKSSEQSIQEAGKVSACDGRNDDVVLGYPGNRDQFGRRETRHVL